MKNKKILVIGPIAPPYGGVSIHLLRLSRLLKDKFQFDFIDESRTRKTEFYNIRSLNFLLYIKKVRNADLIYIHSGKNILRILNILVSKLFLKKTIITIHSYTFKKPAIVYQINSFFFRMANTIIIVNPEINDKLKLSNNKYIVKEAFIPPSIEDESELPVSVVNWLLINKKDNSSIICSNAYTLDSYNNEDLYGLDLCIEVTERLLNKGIHVIFIFVVSLIQKNNDKFFKYQTLIKKLNLEKNFLLINEKLSFVKLIERANIVIRATNTDGDSLTIREALFLNKIVIASDVTKRPTGAKLFKNRNLNDLEKQIEKALNHISNNSKDLVSKGNLSELKDFYLSLLKNTINPDRKILKNNWFSNYSLFKKKS